MSAVKPEDLKKAYKKEKDPRVKIRMAAVNLVCINNDNIKNYRLAHAVPQLAMKMQQSLS